MTTPLEKPLKRELRIDGRAFILTISPEGLKLTLKGRRKGLELRWEALVSGEAALAVALNASVGQFTAEAAPRQGPARPIEGPKSPPSIKSRKERSRAR